MGGFGSGRKATSQLTSEYIPIDTMMLLKRGCLTGDKLKTSGQLNFSVTQRTFEKWGQKAELPEKQALLMNVERYADGQPGMFSQWDASGHLSLTYTIKVGEVAPVPMCHDLPLVVTHPHYGGVRWWFLAPCCGRRVRVVYLELSDRATPHCRACLALNYASQRQSYIERHKTYERYLLTNYGYAWAEIEYHSLKKHYFEITPEWEEIMQRSILERRAVLIHHLMKHQRFMLSMHVQQLRSLKHEEDLRVFVAGIAQEHSEAYMLDLSRAMNINLKQDSDEAFEQAYKEQVKQDGLEPPTIAPGEDVTAATSMQNLIEQKEAVESAMKFLREQRTLVPA